MEADTHTDQRRFSQMGTDAHVVMTGSNPAALVAGAVASLESLERAWSRFLPSSEISQLNAAAGSPVPVSMRTFDLIGQALVAWQHTAGRFDPTLLNSLVELGYDRSFAHVRASSLPANNQITSPGLAGAVLDGVAGTVSLPSGVGFDPGGIGKGYAADLVCEEAMRHGASGAMVNLGGDLRVSGTAPDGRWTVEIVEPAIDTKPITRLTIASGAIATSTTQRRRWDGPDGERHHLLNPATGQPHTNGPILTTVVAGEAWWAEAVATALMGPSPELPPGCAALRLFADGSIERLGGLERYES